MHSRDRRSTFTPMKMKRCAAAIAVLAVLLILGVCPALAEGLAEHVVIITVDGLKPDYYARADRYGLKIDNLRAMMRDGSYAEAVIGSYPSSTFPSHTTIITGVWPAKHGIVSNTVFGERGSTPDWYWSASSIRATTLWQAAHDAGLTTGGALWPVTVGAEMDYLVPLIFSNDPKVDLDKLVSERSTPGLLEPVLKKYGTMTSRMLFDIGHDIRVVQIASEIIAAHQPNLLLAHLVQTDSEQHEHGVGTPEVLWALETIDRQIGQIIEATKAAGIFDSTAFIVAGDHGFCPVHTSINFNVLFAEQRLIELDAEGKVLDWQAMVHSNGGSAVIYLKRPQDGRLAQRVRALIESKAAGPYAGIFRIVSREELNELGASPDAFLGLEAAEGYGFGWRPRGVFLTAAGERGRHGYLPTKESMHTGFIASGTGIRKGVVVHQMRQIDIAPTAARLLGIELPEAEGMPIIGVLKTPAAAPAL